MISTTNNTNTTTNVEAPSQLTATTRPRPTVCVIEDDPDIRHVLRVLLAADSYHVIEVTNGVEGLVILRAHPKSLVVLLDQHLPALDGCDLLEVVAHDADLRARHAFILVTGNTQQARGDCGETLDDLDTSVLGKPFAIDHVRAAVEDATQRLMQG